MQINATKRTELGKKAKRVRKERKVPAVIFGPDIDSISISLEYSDFLRAYRECGETTLVDIALEDTKESYKVLIKNIQVHPVSYDIMHASLYKVNLKEKTTASIPVITQGENEIALVKNGQALVLTQLSEIEVEALPMDLPHEFVLDVSGFEEIGDVLTIADLDFDPEKVEVVGHEDDDVVATLDYATIEEEEEEEELTEEELIEGLEATEEAEADEDEEGADSTETTSAPTEDSAE